MVIVILLTFSKVQFGKWIAERYFWKILKVDMSCLLGVVSRGDSKESDAPSVVVGEVGGLGGGMHSCSTNSAISSSNSRDWEGS